MIHQVVIYLRFTSSERVYQTELRDQNTHHRFAVLRLWEQAPALLLSSPALLPFVVLSQVADPEEQLRVVAKGIERIPDPRIQGNVTAATAVLAGLSLSETVVEGILEELGMRESVIYQKWRAEALKEGRAEGRAEGQVEGIRRESEFVLRLLQRRMGAVPEEWLARIRSLPIEQIEALGEALLGFESLTDLEGWLQTHTQGS
jgi:predicted transposase YdaD